MSHWVTNFNLEEILWFSVYLLAVSGSQSVDDIADRFEGHSVKMVRTLFVRVGNLG